MNDYYYTGLGTYTASGTYFTSADTYFTSADLWRPGQWDLALWARIVGAQPQIEVKPEPAREAPDILLPRPMRLFKLPITEEEKP